MMVDATLNTSRVLANRRNKANHISRYKREMGCIICGIDESCVLDLHHIDPNGKDKSIAEMLARNRSLEDLFAEVLKCVVLCANHHRMAHAGIINVHQVPDTYWERARVFIDSHKPKTISPKHGTCHTCGEETSHERITHCVKCTNKKQERAAWPSYESLQQWVRETSYAEVGRHLNVSGNAVKKRLRNHSPLA